MGDVLIRNFLKYDIYNNNESNIRKRQQFSDCFCQEGNLKHRGKYLLIEVMVCRK